MPNKQYIIPQSNTPGSGGSGVTPQDKPAISNQFLNSYSSATGLFTSAQPSFSNLSGTVLPSQSILTNNAQTGTSYAIQDGDRGYAVTLSNATASTIIALTIAQAGAAGAFLSGWYCIISNIGVNAATLTPTTSTIGGCATMHIPPGCSVLIYSDGSNYQVVVQGSNSAASSGQGGFGSWGLFTPITAPTANIAIIGSANQVKTTQFSLSIMEPVRRAAFWIGTTAAAGKIAVAGIYDANRNKIFQATFSTTNASTKVVDSSFTSVLLLPGVYHYALTADATTPTTDTISPGQGGTGKLPDNTLVKVGTAANSMSAGVMPATLGTLSSASISMGLTWFEP